MAALALPEVRLSAASDIDIAPDSSGGARGGPALLHRCAGESGPPRTTLTLLGSTANQTNVDLVRALRARRVDTVLVSAREALSSLARGNLVLARLDVLPGLDGVEPGLLVLLRLERRGVRVLNRASALLTAHDKLRTVQILGAAGLPHPRSVHVAPGGELPAWEEPFVLKPRFGSWGRDVFRCTNREEGRRVLAAVRDRRWFRRHGALAQELVPTTGSDLRLIVARDEVIGAARRIAAAGEWRTNVSLGGSLQPLDPPSDAKALARAAAAAIDADVVGVDLFPVAGGFTVLELNGAVDFDARYSIPGRDVHDDLIDALSLEPGGEAADGGMR